MNGLIEILRTKEWAISPEYLQGAVKVITGNLRSHTQLDSFEKKMPFMAVRPGGDDEDTFQSYTRTRNGDYGSSWDVSSMRQAFVNVMTIDGPVTRDGGACSYGSKDIRDMLMTCADSPYCVGHLFLVDTPGGSSWCINDFRQGVDYAHERGQRVMMFIDGSCYSAGMWLASLCDEIYVMNEADGMGCIGVLASFFTLKDGAHNEFDSEDYHEIYDPESFDKNRWYRDIANSDDDRLLVEELTRLGADFRADIMKAFPSATDEQIHGITFAAGEVMGIFCDGVSTADGCIRRLFDLSDGRAEPVGRTNFINSEYMSIFGKIRAAVSEAEAEAQNQALENEANASLREQVETLTSERDSARAEVETLTAERDSLNSQVESLNSQVTDLTAQVETVTGERDQAQAQVAEQAEEINTLKGQLGSHYQPGNRLNGKPAGEGEQAKSREEQLNECRDKLGWNRKK